MLYSVQYHSLFGTISFRLLVSNIHICFQPGRAKWRVGSNVYVWRVLGRTYSMLVMCVCWHPWLGTVITPSHYYILLLIQSIRSDAHTKCLSIYNAHTVHCRCFLVKCILNNTVVTDFSSLLGISFVFLSFLRITSQEAQLYYCILILFQFEVSLSLPYTVGCPTTVFSACPM